MYKEIAKLIVYGSLPEDEILVRLGGIFRDFEEGTKDPAALTSEIYAQVKRILQVGTDYGFDKSLWQDYLTFLLITNENPFTITSENKKAPADASVNSFVKNDFAVFMNLFHFDFGPIEKALSINCFSVLTDYTAIGKPELMYNKNVSEKVRSLSDKLAAAEDVDTFFDLVTGFYDSYGVGMFGLNKAFRINVSSLSAPDAWPGSAGSSLGGSFGGDDTGRDKIRFCPINNMDSVSLEDLVGYEIQKKKLIDNTEAFVNGRPANNVLLFGDSGTGKSTSVKAIVNRYYDRGLRMIEIYKHQFKDLSGVIAAIKNRNYRFIIYMDDLSFEDNETEYKFLKAVIEGGVETKPENILIYATSNRRHLINETWKDRADVTMSEGIHKSDTMEEKLSLVHRFGLTIGYTKPNQKEYFHIVEELAARAGITMPKEELFAEANKWELMYGGISGRTAQQFVNHLLQG
ncbi:MAG: ATP-binding protein [Lachnospiraceae bacterium]|nr:ATP-binding protein [Lachnospiraceae bacterium]